MHRILSAILLATVAASLGAADGGADLESLYRHFHQHPELSGEEARTAERLAQELRARGYEVTTGVGGHGVVAVLKNGVGPTLLLRADMDGLPVTERTGLPYASTATVRQPDGQTVGVMHACGHDVHMAVLVGAAEELQRRRAEWRGTLVLVGQPAEETGRGAQAMLKDGLYRRFPRPDYAFALHTSASHPAGTVHYSVGPALASVDSVDVVVRGVGGHGAYPHLNRDPVVLAAQIVLALQAIVSREIDPRQPAVVTVGSIQGGTKHNITPEEVKLQLTVRSYAPEVRQQILAAIERIARHTARAAGMPEDALPVITVLDEYTPATLNDPQLSERLADALRRKLGVPQVQPTDPVMGGEDFSRYGQTPERVPAALFWLGAVDPRRHAAAQKGKLALPSLHSPEFAPLPGPTLRTGVTTMVTVALELLAPANS